jgi:hypothetical protein
MGYSSLLWEPIPQLIPTVVRTGTGTCTARLGWDSTAGRMGQYRIGAVSCWLITCDRLPLLKLADGRTATTDLLRPRPLRALCPLHSLTTLMTSLPLQAVHVMKCQQALLSRHSPSHRCSFAWYVAPKRQTSFRHTTSIYVPSVCRLLPPPSRW